MMQFIWHILLTVCLDNQCVTQDVQWFDKQEQCLEMLPIYRSIPQDGEWDSVTYICKPLHSEST